MHELSIALSILDIAEEEAGDRVGRVAAVHLKLGPLSGVVKEALLSAYDLAREGTALAQDGAGDRGDPARRPLSRLRRRANPGVASRIALPGLRHPVQRQLFSGRELEVSPWRSNHELPVRVWLRFASTS